MISMNEEEDRNNNKTTVMTTVDQFPFVQTPPEYSSNNIYPSKQSINNTDRSKYLTTNRPTSLPPAKYSSSSSSLNENVDGVDVKERRRRASESNTINHKTIPTTSLVTSFLQYLRNELKTTKIDRKHNIHKRTRQKSSDRPNSYYTSIKSHTGKMNSKLSNENLLELNDHDEILTLIDLLVLRVECLSNENKSSKKKKKKKQEEPYPSVSEVDQNLLEYLYYLFTKFINDDPQSSSDSIPPMIDKNNFVNVCQTLVRNGSFDIPSISSNPSLSDSTSNISEQTVTHEASVHEYDPDSDPLRTEKSSPTNEQETWLVVELDPPSCQLPTSLSDEQLLITNDNYKSSESESSPSIYLSPNASLGDIQYTVQEIDEFNEDETPSNSNTTVSNNLLNDDIQSSHNICTRLTNDDSSIENSEQMTTNNTDKMSQREKKMQERWSTSTKNDKNDQSSSSNPLLGIDFPQISVLRRKFSTTSTKKPKIEINSDSNSSSTIEEINTSSATITVNKTNPDQIFELPSKDPTVLINTNVDENNDNGQLTENTSELICLLDEEIMMKNKQEPLLAPIESHTKTITNVNDDLVDNQQHNNDNSSVMITKPLDSNSLSLPCSPLISISPSPLMLTTNENKTIESLPKENEDEEEAEEEEKKEEQRCDDAYNIDEEKKNNSSCVHDYHASGILLINDEPTQTALLHQEKKEKNEEREKEERERPSSPLPPTQEQFNHQRTEDESSIQTLSKDLNKTAMITTDEIDERFKKIELEEIPDDEEIISPQSIDLIEPTDYIHTDDEPKKSTPPPVQTNNDELSKYNPVVSCYEKAFAKIVDSHDESSASPSNTLSQEPSTTSQRSSDDPIALRALQRFEERMNAAAAKTNKPDTNTLIAKGKSSWSGSLAAPRKSVENLFKNTEQQLQPAPAVALEQPITVSSDSYIRPRKTFDDAPGYGTGLNLFASTIHSTNGNTNNNDHKLEAQEQQEIISTDETDDKRVDENNSMTIIDTIDQQDQQQEEIITNIPIPIEHDTGNEIESVTLTSPLSTDRSYDTVMSHSYSTDQSGITPYRFQYEGRRRLNTMERLRERQQSREALDKVDHEQNQEIQRQFEKEYSIKPEVAQDPIIRRALERFDEKNRSLSQTKSMNYDEIHDPITRRALMRLESNLKRTIPTPSNDSNQTWYTENYTLGALQPTNDQFSRYPDSSQALTTNNKTKYISVHQRYCTPSSNDTSDLSTTNEINIPVMKVPPQPIYLTSNNQQSTNLRQRSRSEDMLASRDLTIGQTTNLDDIDTTPSSSSQIQRNRSSNEIALNEPGHLMPNSLIKTLEPSFVRTTESAVSYATPTQTYSAYSCEYTRPRRNPLVTSATNQQESNQLPPPPPHYSQQQQNEIQRPTPYRPTIDNQSSSSSSYAPIQSSTTTTSTYYNQQPLPTSSYPSSYASNNLNQTPYTEDPIVRRALERFNSQLQNSLLSTSQHVPNSYSAHQGNFQDSYINSTRSPLMTTSTSSIGNGYQSIIGRRRLAARADEQNHLFHDAPSVGDGYTSSLFVNSQNAYPPTANHYMNLPEQPPVIPPRFRRDNFDVNETYRRHSTDDYLSENINTNNNNNNNNNNTFIHHAYPATITNSTGFRPINNHYNQFSQEQDDLHDRAQSVSSTNSSDSTKHARINPTNILNSQHRLPPTSIRTTLQQKTNQFSSDNSPVLSGHTTPSNGSVTGDSVFHRLAYTGTKASLSKTSSNSCSNLLNKNSTQIPSTVQLKSYEIDFDDVNDDLNNKYQRSKSVDTRTKLKYSQNHDDDLDDDDPIPINGQQQKSTIIPSSKFTPINNRRDSQSRVPLTPTSTPRTLTTKRPSNGNILPYTKNSRSSNGNLFDTENDENLLYNDNNYEPKIVDHRARTSIPIQRYATNNNHIQTSTSTSSVNSTMNRTKPINLDRRDSNASITDMNRISKRSDDNRLVSPSGQRRNIPVSVFSPAKVDNKRPAPAPPTFNYESQTPIYSPSNDNEMNTKPVRKTSTGNLLNDLTFTTDKQDNNKKMNVFERLFRGNKKKN